MFDSDHTQTNGRGHDHNLDRLCAVYDDLLERDGVVLSPESASELTALAGIFDLDIDRQPREVWRDLRAFLVRQAPRSDDELPAAITRDEALTLLLVEDDAETAADLMETLTGHGHRVIGPFHSAEAAEVSAGLHAFDLALLDINLSGEIGGVELARSLKTRWGMPVLFLSGDVGATARHAELAQAIVLKPYRGRDVLDAISRVANASI